MQVSKYLTWYHTFDENIQSFIWTGRYLFYATTCKWVTMEQVESKLRLTSSRDFASGTLYASQVALNLSNCQQK